VNVANTNGSSIRKNNILKEKNMEENVEKRKYGKRKTPEVTILITKDEHGNPQLTGVTTNIKQNISLRIINTAAGFLWRKDNSPEGGGKTLYQVGVDPIATALEDVNKGLQANTMFRID
jgi:hypothetical protein